MPSDPRVGWTITGSGRATGAATRPPATEPDPPRNASQPPARAPRGRTQRRPATAPAHPPGGADHCRCRARDNWPVHVADFTDGTGKARTELRHDRGRCGLPPTPTTLRSQP